MFRFYVTLPFDFMSFYLLGSCHFMLSAQIFCHLVFKSDGVSLQVLQNQCSQAVIRHTRGAQNRLLLLQLSWKKQPLRPGKESLRADESSSKSTG